MTKIDITRFTSFTTRKATTEKSLYSMGLRNNRKRAERSQDIPLRGRIILALALLVMVATVPSFTGSLEDMTLGKKLDSVILYDNTNGPNNPNSYLTSSDILTGILDPIEVEQQAFVTSGNLSAKTDTNPLESTDLPIDTIHDWMGSQAGVDVGI